MKISTLEKPPLHTNDVLKHYTSKTEAPRFILVGLGPYTKRNYFEQFFKYNFFPELIIDLECNHAPLSEFLQSRNLSIPLYCLSEENRTAEVLPDHVKRELLAFIQKHKITHAIVSTEPKAHFAYLDFFIEHGISTLVEKPLTAPQMSSFSNTAAIKVETDYQYLLNKLKQSPHKNLRVDVNCHRRYHPIYQFVLKEIQNFIGEFDIPMTFCDIYHCDGMWNMPDEFLSRENHPYKYGYGKLLHSGYHFIDLFASLVKTCYGVCSKVPDEAEIYGVPYAPSDFLNTINADDYNNFFPNHTATKGPLPDPKSLELTQCGELDFFSIIQLFQKNQRLTTCSMNLLQTGLSQRAWNTLPDDTYQANGRLRHERLNVQCGMLFNIQVHSYTSREARERNQTDSIAMGGNNHFDVSIFRNSKLIGGEPFTHFTSDHFQTDSRCTFNEISRQHCLLNFLFDGPSLSPLKDHGLAIKMLSYALQTLCERNNGRTPIKKFSIKEKDL